MGRRYTKTDLEEIVYTQLENLNAMHDLLRILKTQNDLIELMNERMNEEITGINKLRADYSKLKKKSHEKNP